MTNTQFIQLVQQDAFRRMVRVALRMKHPTQSPEDFHREYLDAFFDILSEEVGQFAESYYQVEAIAQGRTYE